MLNTAYKNNCLKYKCNINEKIQRIKSKLALGNTSLIVGHYVSDPTQYFGILGRELSNEPLFEYRVIVNSLTPTLSTYFKNIGVQVIELKEISDRFNSGIDVLFIQHPYYNIGDVSIDFYGIMSPLPQALLGKEIKDHPLLCYIPYAFSVINDEEHFPINGHYNLPINNIAWKVFCETDWHKRQAECKSISKGNNYVVTGYPKLDDYPITQPYFDKFNTTIRKDVTIIWAPHHNPNLQNIPINIIHRMLVDLMKKNKNIRIVFRPHPNLLNSNIDEVKLQLEKGELIEIFNYWQSNPRGSFDMSPNLYDLFSNTDLMITNCGGFHVEYISTYKPLLSYIRKNSLNEFSQNALDVSGYWSDSVEEIKVFLNDFITYGFDSKKIERINYINNNILRSQASRVIIHNIKSELFSSI